MSYLKNARRYSFGSSHRIVIGDGSKCNDGKGCGALEECVNGKCVEMPLGRRPSPGLRLRTRGLDPFQRKVQANARRYSFGANPCGGCPPGTKCVQLQHPLTGVTWWECKEPRHVETPLPDPFGESRGGGSGTLIAPSGRSTRGLNPLQRKMQANAFRQEKQTMSYLENASIGRRRRATTERLNPSQRKGDPVGRSTAMQLIKMGFRTRDGRPDVPAAKKFLNDAFDAGLGQGTPYLMRSAEGIGNTGASFEDRIDMLYGYVGGDISDLGHASFQLLDPQAISEFFYRKDKGSPLANIVAYGVPKSFRDIASAPSVLASCKQQVPGTLGDGLSLICGFGIVAKNASSVGTYSLPASHNYGLQDREFPWEAIARPSPSGGYFGASSPSSLIDYMKDMIKWLSVHRNPSKSLQQPASTKGLNPLQRKLQANTFRPKRNRR